ncbi:PLP-dependent aminotransferase family protein [Nonomuraea aridisoli]|uniref:aminotransferase-like domain-containing protein n=1 Tax=Nonomuraea aridisoli TaxID=2070368 RepID=UPI001F27E78D|nr:PLP-dependent aminotransferase family protein [Nonomuraea aridisoli]
MRHAVSTAPLDAFGYTDPLGRVELREALARYLTRARGLRTRADNIVVCSGAAEGLRLVATALVETGVREVAVEEFGLPAQRGTLTRAGLATPAIALDAGGADISALDGSPNLGAVLLTPSHQFPLGVALHPDRRAAVVDWARRRGAIIIEDDHDGEFRYDRTPVGALQGLGPRHVIYMGTASKSLAPGLRVGWLVVPDHMVEVVVRQKGETEENVGFVNQLAMAEFIDSGAYDRHIRTMRSQYRRRREQLIEAITQRTPGSPDVAIVGLPAGLHVLLTRPGRLVSADAGRPAWKRLAVEPLDLFRHPCSTSDLDGVVVGFASPSPSAWPGALDALVGLLQ